MTASTPRPGTASRTGTGLRGSIGGAAGRAAGVGRRPGCADATEGADGDEGAPRACSTGAPAVASGRVRTQVVGAATARATPRTAVAAAGRTVILRCAAGQPRLRARRRAPAPAATSPAMDRAETGSGSEPSSDRPAVPPGTPAGAECPPLIVWTASWNPAAWDPHAYTIVVAPSARLRSAGPRATVVVPARTTSALTVPAGTVKDASSGFVSPGATTAPSARTSTAGAAAVCRTVSRAWPAGTADMSL